VGALALSSLHRKTLMRKIGQWNLRGVLRYAAAKLLPHGPHSPALAINPYLRPMLKHDAGCFRTLRAVGARYGFSVATCPDHNAASALRQLRKWRPHLIVFSGGNILRPPLLQAPTLGVLNVHLGMLPAVRGMSAPEWSLLLHQPLGVTIHFMDAGVDTGPILAQFPLPAERYCPSLGDLRHRLIAFGVEKLAEVVSQLHRGAIAARPQSDISPDRQFFVIHDRLRNIAEKHLVQMCPLAVHGEVRG
jgi:methionyl-tRNA formyltransferase